MKSDTQQQEPPSQVAPLQSTQFGFSVVEFSVVLCFCAILWFAFFDKPDVAIAERLKGGLASLNHSEINEVSGVLGPEIIVPVYESDTLRRALSELSQYSEGDREIWETIFQNTPSPASLLSAVDAASIAEEIFSEPLLISQEFAKDLELRIGETVRAIGGHIDSDLGTITLPVEAFFPESSIELEAREVSAFRSVCLSWFELASQLPGVLRLVVEVDMPYQLLSRDISGSTDYRLNMVRAQSRALNVLSSCLEQVENTQLFDWVLPNTVSIGRSSNFAVFGEDGDEGDLVRQSIIFRTDIDRYEVARRRWD